MIFLPHLFGRKITNKSMQWKKKRVIWNCSRLERTPDSISGIFNADETALFWKLQPHRTLQVKDEKCQGGLGSTERMTVVLGVCATGEKLYPLVIG